MKKLFVLIFTLILLVAGTGNVLAETDNDGVELLAKVLSVEDYEIETDDACAFTSGQKVRIKILTDDVYKDREYTLDSKFQNDYYRQAKSMRKGDKINVIIYFSEEGRVDDFYIMSKVIYQNAVWLSVLFVILLVVIGRAKGIKSAVSLMLTLGVVIFIMIPFLKNGYSPIPVTIISCFIITIITLIIVGGFGTKSFSAILGTLGGLLVAWGLSWAVAYFGNMTSIATDEVEMLMFKNAEITYNLRGILLSGIIIGCLGAVMDVAMTISSTIHQVKSVNGDLSSKDLFKAGMDVGCDIIGTMANTLILAYTGSALTMILVQSTYGFAISDLLNHDFIMVEVLRSLAGSIGMILTVPLTAFVSAYFAKKIKKLTPKYR